MFGQLPHLLSRNFIVGFFLPATVFIAVSHWIINGLGLSSPLNSLLTTINVLNTAVLAIVTALLAVFFLVANRPITMFKEGYGKLNPVRLLRPKETRYYNNIQYRIRTLSQDIVTVQHKLENLEVPSESEASKPENTHAVEIAESRNDLERKLMGFVPRERDFWRMLHSISLMRRTCYLPGSENFKSI